MSKLGIRLCPHAITTGTLGEMAGDPEIGRAEALRRSMLAMMETEGKDHFAHPM